MTRPGRLSLRVGILDAKPRPLTAGGPPGCDMQVCGRDKHPPPHGTGKRAAEGRGGAYLKMAVGTGRHGEPFFVLPVSQNS
jgi:hypothetical protein